MTKFCPICRKQYGDNTALCSVDGMRLINREDPLIGRLIDGRFRIEKKLGAGGMSVVYRAIDEPTGDFVAIKIMASRLAKDPVYRERFFRESRVAQRIDHENVIKVWELGETDEGFLFMVMEWLPGENLAERMARSKLSLQEAIGISIQVSRGLGWAHDLGIIHRDIKSENVMFLAESQKENKVKLLDFGLAWMRGDPRLTVTGQVFGTPEYLSPEQAVGDAVTEASDMYALGVLIYEMATGAVPFEGGPIEVMRGHLERDPLPPSTLLGVELQKYAADFDRIVLKLLRKKPSARYRDTHHLFDDLMPFYQTLPVDPVSHQQVADSSGARKPTQRRSENDASTRLEIARKRFGQIDQRRRTLGEQASMWIDAAVTELSSLLQTASDLHIKVLRAVELRKEAEAELRIKRERLGRAISELAIDESKFTREVDICNRKIMALKAGISAAKAQRTDPSGVLLKRLSLLRTDRNEKEARLQDLGFQLAQLRGRLGAMSAGFEHDTQAGRNRIRDKAEKLDKTLSELERLLRKVESGLE